MTEIKGKTQSGFAYTIDTEKLNNYEFLEALSKVEVEGNVLYLPIVLQMMLGEQVSTLKEHLRDEDGRITNESLIQEVKDIFSEQETLKKIPTLARMIQIDEDALVCDLAEVYHIYDYRQLPMLRVAVFAFGLRENSRIKMAMNRQKVDSDTLLLAGIQDALNLLVWSKTRDAHKGGRPPTSIVKSMIEEPIEPEELHFATGEDFELARQALLREIGGES